MKLYLEIIQLLTEEETLTSQPQMLRLEVVDDTDAMNKFEKYKSLFDGLKYVARIHYCRHDEGKSCSVKIIKMID